MWRAVTYGPVDGPWMVSSFSAAGYGNRRFGLGEYILEYVPAFTRKAADAYVKERVARLAARNSAD